MELKWAKTQVLHPTVKCLLDVTVDKTWASENRRQTEQRTEGEEQGVNVWRLNHRESEGIMYNLESMTERQPVIIHWTQEEVRRETKRIREEKEKSFSFVLLCRKMTRERRRGDKDADKDVPPTRTTSNTRSVRRVPLQLSDVVGVRRGSEGRVGGCETMSSF